jgi:hypothetical protein
VGAIPSNPSATSHSEQGQSKVEKKNKRLGFVGNNSTAQSIQLKQRLSADAVEMEEPDIKEVWFAGCHGGNLLYVAFIMISGMTQMICTDIGGGAVCNDVEQSLSNISLRWMVREIIASGLGAIFDASALARAKINLDPEPTIPEIEMDSTDALDTLHDQLQSNILWWLLEILPFPYSLQDENNVWHTSYA